MPLYSPWDPPISKRGPFSFQALNGERETGPVFASRRTLEQAIICTLCGYALATDDDRVGRHLGEKHHIPKVARQKLNALINSLQLPRPETLPKRADGSAPHPHLQIQEGKAFPDPIQRLADQLLHEECTRSELHSATLTPPTDGDALSAQALLTNWMRRTGWDRTFEGADCQILLSLSSLPVPSSQPLYLGMHRGGHELSSSATDENRLLSIVAALDRLFDQCGETVRFTDVSVRRWLRSRFTDRPYKAPFELVSQSRSERTYRAEFKRCVCFWLRVWRLPRAVSRSITGRTFSTHQRRMLEELWLDSCWTCCDDEDENADNAGGESPFWLREASLGSGLGRGEGGPQGVEEEEEEDDGSEFSESEDTASDAPCGESLSDEEDGSDSQCEGPTWHFDWSEDGQTISWDGDTRLSMGQFRSLAHEAFRQATVQARCLMYDSEPEDPKMGSLRDRLSSTTPGYSFLTDPQNKLGGLYLTVFMRACIAPVDGLLHRRHGESHGSWDVDAAYAYLHGHDAFLKNLMVLEQLDSGQAARVARFFSPQVAILMYRYLVYIRPTAYAILRQCFRHEPVRTLIFTPASKGTGWTTKVFTEELKRLSRDALGTEMEIGVRLYRQLSIAITERHVRGALPTFDRFDDVTEAGDPDVAFAWQSGHRPMQRHSTYGLDGAFPDKLQPSLLRLYARCSGKWHSFLMIGPEAPPADDSPSQVNIAGQYEAEEEATSIFRRVREKVQRFMTITPQDKRAEPTPMDWIYEARTYGMHIRFNTPAGGTIDWNGDRIKHRRVQFRMGQLNEMLHALRSEARELLTTLTMVEDVDQLPRIPWSSVEDDHSEDKIGYSFLDDDRNGEWMHAGKNWIMRKIGESQVYRKSWIDDKREDGKPFHHRAVQTYEQTVNQFMERLFMLMHMVGGQPARATEILGIRHINTVNGGVRNIFAHNGMTCFVTAYHKGFRATGQVKVIHRYLPQAIGELLVWYLWLVLPFWQQVQGIIKDAPIRSPFMWPDEVVRKSEGSVVEERERRQAALESRADDGRKGRGGRYKRGRGAEEDDDDGSNRDENSDDGRVGSDGDDDEGNTRTVSTAHDGDMTDDDVGFQSWVQERKWTSDRVRRIIQRHSRRLLGTTLNISSWRQIAIAIARRAFKEATLYDDEDDDLDDNPMDLQAGHGTHVAGMVYARELQQGLFSTSDMRDKFRAVSRQWHRLLGFHDGDQAMGRVRKRAPYETERDDNRFRRFRRMQQVNIAGQLRQMMGAGAEFRGQQETVIRVIMRGESPVVQIAGTVEGKSMSFLLPAYCSNNDGGTTVVIVPRGAHQIAPIVFVTPESAVTKGFGEFMARMEARGVLDRVVVDECHTILDSSDQFRPQMLELGRVLNEWGVQKVFLTATLPPEEEGRFFEVTGLPANRVKIFQSRTTRPNIRYRVINVQSSKRNDHHRRREHHGGQHGEEGQRKSGEEAEDDMIVRLAWEWLQRDGHGRAIVYASTIERVERLGGLLECSVYHSKIDTAVGKRQRLRLWMEQGQLIVATNALGLGVDVPDVRLVVHAGMPCRLRNYVQESGRAGRDGN
ncbi:hypothetical protein CEP52_016890 [Fusarium oligoseptatum]|uniref:DNA 3'-5' helicase n=1 Tax=Fusarium oligoseptatum TaxID=2604345 RepID=A0A428RYV3_9HYPO|nr:hypothetical protein CEP52_016890 [Fusarium oligoseptatum]